MSITARDRRFVGQCPMLTDHRRGILSETTYYIASCGETIIGQIKSQMRATNIYLLLSSERSMLQYTQYSL